MVQRLGDPGQRRLPAKAERWDSPDPAKDGVVSLDEGGKILEINTYALKLLECDLPSVTGRDFWELVPEDIADQYQFATDKVLASSAHHVFVAHHKFKDSWLEYTFRRGSNGYVVSLRDVATTQKLHQRLHESERYNQLIFEVNPNAMWIFDAESLQILAVNRAAVEFYGIPREIFLELHLGSLFPDGEGTSLLSALKPEKAAGRLLPTPQICKQKKMDGQLVLVELACGRIDWNEQQAVLVSLADITDRHLADRALRRENAELEEEVGRLKADLKTISRDLTAFTYALSNDLQGPLHAVNGFASMLADKYALVLDEAGRHYVNRIQASTRQLAKLVADLRILVQLPKLSGDLEKIDLEGLSAMLINDLRKHDPLRVVMVEQDIGATLWADKRLLATALSCLLENAWKFTARRAEGWIKISLQAGSQPDELVLQVSDNGSGFDPAYSEKLFSAFQRLHSAADFPGNGLGLAIVKRVAETHGGRVWAQTSATGASFFLAFPQAQMDSS